MVFGKGWAPVCALALFGAVSAQASYEMLLVLDATTKSVHRFDPQSGAYFGQFGQGWFNNPQSLVIDQSTRTAYVRDTIAGAGEGAIIAFNFDTGERVAGVAGGLPFQDAPVQMARNPFNGQFYTSGNNNLYQISPTGTVLSSRGPIVNTGGIAVGSDGFLYATNVDGNQIFRYDATIPIADSGPAAGSATTDFGEGQLTIAGNGRGYLATGFARVMSFSTANLGSWTQINLPNFSATKGVGFGHGTLMYVAGRNAANNDGLIERFDAGLGVAGGTFGSAQLDNPISVAVVVAPEPATVVALGAGALALFRRRRARS